jgi:uncharacterized LabA/DUF88 family protein
MAGRAIRSALLIDIENVSYARLSTSIPNWLAWLEHGQFDPAKQRRKFVLKRAYWNSTSEHDRKKFESRGVAAILVDRYVTLKNTADVHMAIDMIELLHTRPDIEEYVLLSKDSDFIPVMQRLRAKHKRTAMLVDLASPTLHTAFRDKVDIVIPHRDLLLATAYNPPVPKLGLIGRWRANLTTKREQARIEREAKIADSIKSVPANGKAPQSNGSLGPAAPRVKLADGAPLQQAALLVKAVLQPSRGLYVPQKAILSQLKAIPEFTELGTAKFLGAGSYHALMVQLAAADPLMKVDQQNGNHTAVRYLSVREQTLRNLAAEKPKPASRSKTNGTGHGAPRGVTAAVFPPPISFTADQTVLLTTAAAAVRRLAAQRPGAYLPRQGLLDAISSVPGIAIEPPDEFLGTGSLSGFMFEVARRDPEFLISEETGGGKGYRFIPREKATAPRSDDPVVHAPTPVPALPPLLTTGALHVEVPHFEAQLREPHFRTVETVGHTSDPHTNAPLKPWDLT